MPTYTHVRSLSLQTLKEQPWEPGSPSLGLGLLPYVVVSILFKYINSYCVWVFLQFASLGLWVLIIIITGSPELHEGWRSIFLHDLWSDHASDQVVSSWSTAIYSFCHTFAILFQVSNPPSQNNPLSNIMFSWHLPSSLNLISSHHLKWLQL